MYLQKEKCWEGIKGSYIIQWDREKDWDFRLGYPAFVLEIRPETNEVVIGTYAQSLTDTLRANQLNFMAVEELDESRCVSLRKSDIIIKEHGVL